MLEKIDIDMTAAVGKYLEAIKASYATFGKECEIRQQMIDEFNKALTYEVRQKFIKVITGPQRSVHSFIVLADDNKFKRGDILKAASMTMPKYTLNAIQHDQIEEAYLTLKAAGIFPMVVVTVEQIVKVSYGTISEEQARKAAEYASMKWSYEEEWEQIVEGLIDLAKEGLENA